MGKRGFPQNVGEVTRGEPDAAGWRGQVRPQLLGLPILSSELHKGRGGSFHGERNQDLARLGLLPKNSCVI